MKKYGKAFLVFLLLLTGCNFLDMVPENDIETIESIFETRQNASTWLDGTYAMVCDFYPNFAQNVAYFGADEFVACQKLMDESGGDGKYDYPGFQIAAGYQKAQLPFGDYWSRGNEYDARSTFYQTIRSCNTFLEHIDAVYNMENNEKVQWKAEIKALKAFCYFELVRRYGPIVLIDRNIDMKEDVGVMQLPRVHVDTCFAEIVRLCDEAAKVLPGQNGKSLERRAYFSKEAALALKARALLYAASPLFNGNEFYSDFKGKNGELLFSTQKDPNKWRLAAEAADAALDAALEGGHGLYSGTADMGSSMRNTMNDVAYSVLSDFTNTEMLLEWKVTGTGIHILALPLVDENELPDHYNYEARGAISPSMEMVETYYTANGLPISEDKDWNYTNRYKMAQESNSDYDGVVPLNTDVLQLHLRREPRFYASIAADRTYWQRGPVASTVDNNLLVKAYRKESFGTRQDRINTQVYQNISGYWLKKHLYPTRNTYSYSISDDHTMPLIRLAEVYLMQAEAWNEVEGPTQRVYDALDAVRKRAGLDGIVETWTSGKAKHPEYITNKDRMRDIIHQEINIELAFEGHRFFNLRRWKEAETVLNKKQTGWNILGENASAFYNRFNGPIVVDAQRKFTAPRDYLFPINSEEVLISSIVQNPGW